jgi:hypothetical protein
MIGVVTNLGGWRYQKPFCINTTMPWMHFVSSQLSIVQYLSASRTGVGADFQAHMFRPGDQKETHTNARARTDTQFAVLSFVYTNILHNQ